MRSRPISRIHHTDADGNSWAWVFVAALAFSVLTCADAPTAYIPEPDPVPTPQRAVGVVTLRFNVTGAGKVQTSASFSEAGIAGSGARFALTSPDEPGAASVFIEELPDGGSFTHGTPGAGGFRYVYATAKIRNAGIDGAGNWVPHTTVRTNLTLVATAIGGGINGTPFSQLQKFDGTDADPAIASGIKPTGAVRQTLVGGITSHAPDVLQVFTEAEVAHIPDAVPYGYIVQNAATPGSRTLAANPGPTQFDGLLSLGIKIPLQVNPADDVYGFAMSFIVYDDTETRITQSIEEQDAAGQAAFETRVAALSGLSGITLLPGGSYGGASSAAIRRLCAVRIAGTAAAPTAFLDGSTFAASCPTLSGVSPTFALAGTTAGVTLTGTNFVTGAGNTTVAVSGSGVTVNNVVVNSSTELTADLVIAAGAALGTRKVTVTTATGTSGSQDFSVNSVLAPTLTSVTPNNGDPNTAVAVTLNGTNFVNGSTTISVSGGNVDVLGVTYVSSTQLTAFFGIQPTATSGPRSVTITTPEGTSSPQTFTVN